MKFSESRCQASLRLSQLPFVDRFSTYLIEALFLGCCHSLFSEPSPAAAVAEPLNGAHSAGRLHM